MKAVHVAKRLWFLTVWCKYAWDSRPTLEIIAKVIREGSVRTYDMGGSASTLEMGEAVARAL